MTDKSQSNQEMSLNDGDCHCDWLGNEDLQKQVCGGCGNQVKIFRDELVHWREKHWHLRGAFGQAKFELGEKSA